MFMLEVTNVEKVPKFYTNSISNNYHNLNNNTFSLKINLVLQFKGTKVKLSI